MALLNTPLTIKDMRLTNRLVMPPMQTSKSNPDGTVGQGICDYYGEKSRGGFLSLLITEHSFVRMDGKASDGQLSMADDQVVPGLRALAKIVHQNGSKLIAQISHAGSAARSNVTGCQPIAPSEILKPGKHAMPLEMPRALEIGEIPALVQAFADAAKRVKTAGFDGVEIHSAHGYLLNQFYSPLTNHRTDAYGGSLENRIRIHLEVINAVRNAVGDNFVVALRLGACDYMDGGSTIEDACKAAVAFEKAGVDLLDISGGFCGYTVPGRSEPGYFKDASSAVKKVVSIPVILTGGILDGASAERLLAEDAADLIGVGRAVLKDSSWAEKALAALC